MNTTILEEITALIPKSFYPKEGKITRDLELEEDLGITGDDADEMISIFAKKFNVDLEKFNINEYFSQEGEDLFEILKSWFFSSKIKKRGRKRLTIGDLEEAAKSGRLPLQ